VSYLPVVSTPAKTRIVRTAAGALLWAAVLSPLFACRSSSPAPRGPRPQHDASSSVSIDAIKSALVAPSLTAATATASSAAYPVDTSPPTDFFNDKWLRTLTLESEVVVVCRLKGLLDTQPDRREPDIFYDAACDILEIVRGPLSAKTVHFIWQVERGNRMPPPESDLLVFLKRRRPPTKDPLLWNGRRRHWRLALYGPPEDRNSSTFEEGALTNGPLRRWRLHRHRPSRRPFRNCPPRRPHRRFPSFLPLRDRPCRRRRVPHRDGNRQRCQRKNKHQRTSRRTRHDPHRGTRSARTGADQTLGRKLLGSPNAIVNATSTFSRYACGSVPTRSPMCAFKSV
jgi:hypothetical protein